MTALVLRGDAAHLPLPDGSVDLIVTSPPYFGLRSYSDGGEVYEGQIGSEETPKAYIAALLDCTREWTRALKPGGSIFVNLGDKYSTYTGANWGNGRSLDGHRGTSRVPDGGPVNAPGVYGIPYKSLMGLPWRYALGCIDDLGLTLRAEIIWDKPNGMPESATDRVRRSHEQVFHLVKESRGYFAAVDEIREPHAAPGRQAGATAFRARDASLTRTATGDYEGQNPLGRMPGSVWEIPPVPLNVPARLDVDHFAAYPPELCRRIILGWSPPGICAECGEGRRPVTASLREINDRKNVKRVIAAAGALSGGTRRSTLGDAHNAPSAVVIGYACTCTPYTDHPGSREPTRRVHHNSDAPAFHPQGTYGQKQAGEYERVGPWREYHLDRWTPPPTRPALVVDPFGGTGTTMLTASVLGRIGIGVDRSADYCRLARWRTSDPAERARALGVPKPPPVPEGQGSLFDELEAS